MEAAHEWTPRTAQLVFDRTLRTLLESGKYAVPVYLAQNRGRTCCAFCTDPVRTDFAIDLENPHMGNPAVCVEHLKALGRGIVAARTRRRSEMK